MGVLVVVGIGVGLAMDAFAVAVAVSVALGRATSRQTFRLAFHFGLFQCLMPILGWLAGRTVERWIVAWDHWVAFALLAFVGGKAIWTALCGKADESRDDPTRGVSLVVLSLATSVDALVVGLTFAVLGVEILYPCVVIGVVTGAITALGMQIGSRLGARFGRAVEVGGGVVLLAIGARILLQHLGG